MATYTDLEEACQRLAESLAKALAPVEGACQRLSVALEEYLEGVSARLGEAIEGPDLEALWLEGLEAEEGGERYEEVKDWEGNSHIIIIEEPSPSPFAPIPSLPDPLSPEGQGQG